MPSDDMKTEFRRGCRHGLPVAVTALPFAVLFGTLAVESGLGIGEAVFMSATVFAGASQMVGIELFGQHIAPWMIVFSIFAVNFRHVLYSAAIGRHTRHWALWQKAAGFFFLVDPQYAETERKATSGKRVSFSWYLGVAIPLYVLWVAGSWAGAEFGRLIPDTYALGLDYLLPIYFLGMVLDFRKRPLWTPVVLASGIVSSVAYVHVGSPWHVSIGAAAGILLAALLTPGHSPVTAPAAAGEDVR